MEGWVPIRDLHARHRDRILDHLLHLDERDRYLRFGFQAPQEQLSRYVASIDFKRDEVFGIFNRRLHLVAVAHLAAMPGQGPHGTSSRGRAMEFGVSVLPAGRGKGLGMRLFQHAITHARNKGASHLMIHALSGRDGRARRPGRRSLAQAAPRHHGQPPGQLGSVDRRRARLPPEVPVPPCQRLAPHAHELGLNPRPGRPRPRALVCSTLSLGIGQGLHFR
jgi:GNAT superfamily N-acetyltransferase